MIARTCALALCLLALHGNAPARAQDYEGAREAYRAGRYDEAITALRAMKPGAEEWTPSRKLLAEAFRTTGKYDDAERVARQETASPNGRELFATLGDLLAARGKRAAAESAYTANGVGGSAATREIAGIVTAPSAFALTLGKP